MPSIFLSQKVFKTNRGYNKRTNVIIFRRYEFTLHINSFLTCADVHAHLAPGPIPSIVERSLVAVDLKNQGGRSKPSDHPLE
jgi:hypothetical protein